MKVHSHAIDAYARTALNSTTPARPVEPPATQTSNSNEAATVTVSQEARALAAGGAGVDETKVAALKKQIADGEYRVNPQMLAMRILETIG
jgi:flagellar biosynthesis anti-sigma factor FlgM